MRAHARVYQNQEGGPSGPPCVPVCKNIMAGPMAGLFSSKILVDGACRQAGPLR